MKRLNNMTMYSYQYRRKMERYKKIYERWSAK